MQTLSKRGERDWVRYARNLHKKIGAHHRMIGNSNYTDEEYKLAQSESDLAVQEVKYLVKSVSNRHIAVIVASFSGCPSFINYR